MGHMTKKRSRTEARILRTIKKRKEQLLNKISRDKKIWGGAPVIKGTRIAVHLIIYQLANGESIENIMKDYGITKEDILAALWFAADELNEKYYK